MLFMDWIFENPQIGSNFETKLNVFNYAPKFQIFETDQLLVLINQFLTSLPIRPHYTAPLKPCTRGCQKHSHQLHNNLHRERLISFSSRHPARFLPVCSSDTDFARKFCCRIITTSFICSSFIYTPFDNWIIQRSNTEWDKTFWQAGTKEIVKNRKVFKHTSTELSQITFTLSTFWVIFILPPLSPLCI